MDNGSPAQEMFVQNGITLLKAGPKYDSVLNQTGVLSFCKSLQGNGFFFEWKPMDMCEVMETGSLDSDWSMVNTSTQSDGNASPRSSSHRNAGSLRVYLKELKGIELGTNELCLFKQNMALHSMYLFLEGEPESLADFLERKHILRRSTIRKEFYHFLKDNDNNNDSIPRIFSELSMRFMYPWISSTSVSQTNGDAESILLAARPDVHRGDRLEAKNWAKLRASDGSITDPDEVKAIVFRGGIADEIRAEVWKYLLGLDIWEHTTAEREERRKIKYEEYSQMKQQWQTFSRVQERNFCDFKQRREEIEFYVKHTDTAYEFFQGVNNPNVQKMRNILVTYVMYNFDLGFGLGMNELLAPMLCAVRDEADTFWCFAGFVEKVADNFDFSKTEMKQQREELRLLVSFVNEKLHSFLKQQHSQNMIFCYRYLHIWFKNEFSYPDIMQLWEVLWTGLPCPNFYLFVCLAILDQETDAIIEGQFQFAELVNHVLGLSGKLNLTAILEQAEAIYLQVKKTLDSSGGQYPEVRRIIGEV